MFRDRNRTLRAEVHELINSVCKKEELSQKKKDSTNISVCKKINKVDYSNYKGIALLSPTY